MDWCRGDPGVNKKTLLQGRKVFCESKKFINFAIPNN